MTSTQPGGRPVDVDALADYVDGLLDADATAEVADLIRDDPAWSATYAQLTAAQPLVTTALSSLRSEPMPTDVADRIDGALRSLEQPSNVVALAPRRSRPSGDALRSGWLKVAAAVILAVIGLGVVVRVAQSPTSDSAKSSAASGSITEHHAIDPVGQVIRNASGTDYTKATLATRPNPGNVPQAAAPTGVATRGPAIGAPSGPSSFGADKVSSALQRLADPEALESCLAAVANTTGGVPTTVDYALYLHRPALIVGFADLPYSVAVGPTCGEPGAGAAIVGRG